MRGTPFASGFGCPPLQIDNKRGNYHLLEGKLASVLLKAANIDRNSPEGKAVREWRKPGARTAGNFAEVVKRVSGECGRGPGAGRCLHDRLTRKCQPVHCAGGAEGPRCQAGARSSAWPCQSS